MGIVKTKTNARINGRPRVLRRYWRTTTVLQCVWKGGQWPSQILHMRVGEPVYVGSDAAGESRFLVMGEIRTHECLVHLPQNVTGSVSGSPECVPEILAGPRDFYLRKGQVLRIHYMGQRIEFTLLEKQQEVHVPRLVLQLAGLVLFVIVFALYYFFFVR